MIDAIKEIRETVNADFDANNINGKYITEDRLLQWRNTIRQFRNLQLVNLYNE